MLHRTDIIDPHSFPYLIDHWINVASQRLILIDLATMIPDIIEKTVPVIITQIKETLSITKYELLTIIT
jgi:hypothetical protein